MSDEAQHEDQVESDDDEHDNHNFTAKHTTSYRERRSEDRTSVRSESSKKNKRSSSAENGAVSPVLVR